MTRPRGPTLSSPTRPRPRSRWRPPCTSPKTSRVMTSVYRLMLTRLSSRNLPRHHLSHQQAPVRFQLYRLYLVSLDYFPDSAPSSNKGKSTPGQKIKNRSKLFRVPAVDDLSNLGRTSSRLNSGPSRGWLRARANEKSRRQLMAEKLFKR